MNLERVKNLFRGKGRPASMRRSAVVLDPAGGEILDSTPMQPPLGYNPQPSMFDVMKDMIRREREALEREGYETPEEADDFDVDDDLDPSSPYEHSFDPPAEPSRLPQNELPAEPATPPQPGRGAKPRSEVPASEFDGDTLEEQEPVHQPREARRAAAPRRA